MSKLREAAQAVIDRWDSPEWTRDAYFTTGELIAALRDAIREDALACLSDTHQQLDAELGEQLGGQLGEQLGEEYEFIGTIDGTHGGRWVLAVKDKAAVWPLGAAVYVKMYVRRAKK